MTGGSHAARVNDGRGLCGCCGEHPAPCSILRDDWLGSGLAMVNSRRACADLHVLAAGSLTAVRYQNEIARLNVRCWCGGSKAPSGARQRPDLSNTRTHIHHFSCNGATRVCSHPEEIVSLIFRYLFFFPCRSLLHMRVVVVV